MTTPEQSATLPVVASSPTGKKVYMAPNGSLVVVPPKATRTRESSADASIVAAMAKECKPGVYVTDGATSGDYQKASNASQTYRRALSEALNIPAHTIKSRVWGEDGKGVLITDREKPGTWRFALTVDPSRQKRTRKQKPAPAVA